MEASYNATAYEAGRPSYPDPAVAHLLDALGVGPATTVLDLAAGTGKFTRRLVGVAGTVTAVEPDPAMRRELSRLFPTVDVREGSGTAIPFRANSVDVVTIAQAYHWFAGRAALAEIARVLRPEGRLGLIWNVRDMAAPVQQGLERIFQRYRRSSPTYRNSGWRLSFDEPVPFQPLSEAVFTQSHAVDRGALNALALSMSYMSGLDDAARAAVADSVAAVFAEHAAGDPPLVTVRYRTEVFWTQVDET